MKKWKIILILIIPFLTFGMGVHIILPFYQFIVHNRPIPSYHAPAQAIDAIALCEKIYNQQLRETCFSKVENPNLQIPLLILKEIGEKSEDVHLCVSIPLSEFIKRTSNHTSSNNLEALISYITSKKIEPLSEIIFCYQALLENPYYCNRIDAFYNYVSPNICYGDAALIWEDTSLCLKVKDKDRCYFRLALQMINN